MFPDLAEPVGLWSHGLARLCNRIVQQCAILRTSNKTSFQRLYVRAIAQVCASGHSITGAHAVGFWFSLPPLWLKPLSLQRITCDYIFKLVEARSAFP